MRPLLAVSAVLLLSGAGLGAYAKFGSFHPHGFGQLFPVLGAAALVALGALGLLIAFLFYVSPRS